MDQPRVRLIESDMCGPYNTDMKNHRALFASVIVAAAVVLVAGVHAQYAGWTVPATAKTEKSPLKPSPDVIKKGRANFVAKCQKCHGPEAKGDGPDSNPQAPAADLTDEFRYELNPEGVLYHKILGGKPPDMPAFKSQMSSEEVWQIVEYLKSIRKPA
jgi:mono/diheme cytochrome c family protein